MLVETSLQSLAAGSQVSLSPGDTLRVTVRFKYAVAQDALVTLKVCPYQYRLGILDRIGGSCGQKDVELTRSTTQKLIEVAVDMPVIAASEGGIDDGTYGLIAEIEGTDIGDKVDSCLVISGNPASVWEMLPTLGMIMVMGLLLNAMEGS